MITELPDPFDEAITQSPWLKTRRFLGRYKRRLLGCFQRKAPPPSPVIGFTDGANGNLDKRALITYVARPFYMEPEELKAGNSNRLQSVAIASTFNRLGYVVDVVDFLDEKFVPTVHYHAFFGM